VGPGAGNRPAASSRRCRVTLPNTPSTGTAATPYRSSTPNRKRILRRTVAKVGAEERIWTTTLELLPEHGPLGDVWQGVGRVRRGVWVADLPDRVRIEHRIPDCIAKVGRWLRRPGGSEEPEEAPMT
jgi:hypothetical protein